MHVIGSRRERSGTPSAVDSNRWLPGSTRLEGGRSTRGRGVRARVARRGARCPTCPNDKARTIAGLVHLAGFCARTHCANARTAGSIRFSGRAEKPIRKLRRASPSSFMKRSTRRPVGDLASGSRGSGAGRRGDTSERPMVPRRSGGRQDAVMPMPNTCILPALTWRGSTMLVTTLPGGTGSFCAKM